MKIRVTQLLRCPVSGFYSIELLYADVREGFEKVRRFNLAEIAAQYAALYRAMQARAALGSRGRA